MTGFCLIAVSTQFHHPGYFRLNFNSFYMETGIMDRTDKKLSTPAGPTTKYVFAFREGNGKNKQLLGGKGANLCEMTQIDLNVPPGFVISTQACMHYLGSEKNYLQG